MIITVDRTNLLQAAMIHSIPWKESHRSFCVPDFVEMHTRLLLQIEVGEVKNIVIFLRLRNI